MKLITAVLRNDGKLYIIVTETKSEYDMMQWVRTLHNVERSWIVPSADTLTLVGESSLPWFDNRLKT